MLLAENVKGILTLGDGTIIEAIMKILVIKDIMYSRILLIFADYGATRSVEVFMIGFRRT